MFHSWVRRLCGFWHSHGQRDGKPLDGMFFDPLNDPENTTGLKGRWHEILQQAFHIYTPVVIGYGGGDHSLMEFLADERL